MKKRDYSDMIDLPHYELREHKRMSMDERSAHFSAFAALSDPEDVLRAAEERKEQK